MKNRAGRNKTIYLSVKELADCSKKLLRLDRPVSVEQILNRTICQDTLSAVPFLPDEFVGLLFIDPPYNLDKDFNGFKFKKQSQADYLKFLETYIRPLLRLLKETASVYICSDWNSCGAVQLFAQKYLIIQNRITWEREKGRGAKSNWKNCSEDIWFCTVSDKYAFNVEAVKLKRRVIAPYTVDNQPKDWQRETQGDFRLTHPSNLWTDLTVPFWSMPENTDHPTQKPEKLIAKIILASSNEGDIILDPFLGSGTTAVVAKKLGRSFVGIEIDKDYCCLAEKRLESAELDRNIQGYSDGVFWERNTKPVRLRRIENFVINGRK
jgi:site-specific DNA-methyltransferase (adenine-specific)